MLISDDGSGMTESGLVEALRFGTRRDYSTNELGRFGLGLKTGSFSQCRKLTVVTRTSQKQRVIRVMTLDLNRIARSDRWDITANETSPAIDRACAILRESPGTVVVWEDLDRVLPERYAENGWGRRRLRSLASKTSERPSRWSSTASSRARSRAVERSSSVSMTRSSAHGTPSLLRSPNARSCMSRCSRSRLEDGLLGSTVPWLRTARARPVLFSGGVRATLRPTEVEPPAGPAASTARTDSSSTAVGPVSEASTNT